MQKILNFFEVFFVTRATQRVLTTMKTSILILIWVFASCTNAAAQWEQLNSPGGGNISTFAVLGPKVFVNAGGLFISSDSGASWNPVSQIFPSGRFSIDVNEGNVLIPDGSIYISSDSGSSWIEKSSGIMGANFGLVAANGSCMVASSIDGTDIYLSTNGGDSWDVSDSGLNFRQIIYLARCGKNFIMRSDNEGVNTYVSTDSGRFWFPDTAGMGNKAISSVIMLGPDVFAETDGGALFKSSDSGVVWSQIESPVYAQQRSFILNSNGMDLFISSGLGSGSIYQSSDRGKNWFSLKSNSRINDDATSIAAIGPYVLTGTYDAGVFRIGGRDTIWVEENSGLPVAIIKAIAVSDSVILASAPQQYTGTVFRSTDDGKTWRLDTVLTAPTETFQWFGNELFTSSNGVYSSTDKGSTWMHQNNGILGNDGGIFSIIDSNLYLGSAGVFFWTDTNSTWTKIPRLNVGVNSLAGFGSILFAGTESGLFIRVDSTWTLEQQKDVGQGTYILSVAAVDSTVFVGTIDYGLVKSTDKGVSWTSIGAPQPGAQATILLATGENLFVYMNNHIYLTNSDGTLWTPIDEGHIFNSLAINGSYLYAGGNGVWRRPLSDLGLSSVTQIATAKTFPTIFPNPSSTNLTITADNIRRIRIFDLLGTARFEQVYNDAQNPTLDVSALAPGVYAVEVTTATGTNVVRMVKE